jgi:hypothetical protein
MLTTRITRAIVVVNRGETYYFIDFINKAEPYEGYIKRLSNNSKQSPRYMYKAHIEGI